MRIGASQGVHGYGASEGPQTVTVIQEQDGELRCHPAPRASLWMPMSEISSDLGAVGEC